MCIENYRQSLFLLPFRNRYTPLERRVPYPLSPFCLRERNAATTHYTRPQKRFASPPSPARATARTRGGKFPRVSLLPIQHSCLVTRNAGGNSTAEAAPTHENTSLTTLWGIHCKVFRAAKRGRAVALFRILGGKGDGGWFQEWWGLDVSARTRPSFALFADASAPARWKPQCLWTCEKHRAGHRMIAFGKDGCEKGCFHA
jgi:hypothetical protein